MSDEELLQLSNEAFCAAKDDATLRDVRLAILRKVAAHVRAMTLREAAGVCESSAVTCDEQEQVASPEFNRAYWKGVAKGFRQAANNMRAAADATGKDGVS